MTANALQIIHVGLTATLTRTTQGNHPREQIELPELERTATGSINRDGPAYVPPHIWNPAFIVDSDTLDTLIVQHAAWRDSPSSFLIYDTISKYSEATQTRAAVPGTTVTSKGGRVLYYPQFRGEFQGDLKYSSQGFEWYNVSFQMIETEVVPVA
ncbi:MAG: hypothetical protein AAF609_05320 [Cyanobacteria bacterium P01_C01_bin.120]